MKENTKDMTSKRTTARQLLSVLMETVAVRPSAVDVLFVFVDAFRQSQVFKWEKNSPVIARRVHDSGSLPALRNLMKYFQINRVDTMTANTS